MGVDLAHWLRSVCALDSYRHPASTRRGLIAFVETVCVADRNAFGALCSSDWGSATGGELTRRKKNGEGDECSHVCEQ